MTQSPQTNAKGFSKAFWVSNTVELFERMAYYAVFIVLTIYLSSILGFNDFEASMISGLFSGGLYLLPISCLAVRSLSLLFPHRWRKKPPKQPVPAVIPSFI